MDFLDDLPRFQEMLESILADHHFHLAVFERKAMGVTDNRRLSIVITPNIEVEILVPSFLQGLP
jgi:hypothetical protein